MKIVLLGSRDWSVYAVVDDSNSNDDTCELLDFFETLAAQHHGSRDGMFQLFERFAERGRSIFNDAICHYVDQEEKIFEFIKGDIRVLWFYAGHDKTIVCTHGFLKDGKKTPTADKKNKKIIVVENEN